MLSKNFVLVRENLPLQDSCWFLFSMFNNSAFNSSLWQLLDWRHEKHISIWVKLGFISVQRNPIHHMITTVFQLPSHPTRHNNFKGRWKKSLCIRSRISSPFNVPRPQLDWNIITMFWINDKNKSCKVLGNYAQFLCNSKARDMGIRFQSLTSIFIAIPLCKYSYNEVLFHLLPVSHPLFSANSSWIYW